MASLWRQQPGSRISRTNLVQTVPHTSAHLVADDFFEAPMYHGTLHVWNGTSWVAKALRTFVWNSWQTKQLRWWDGAAWCLVRSS